MSEELDNIIVLNDEFGNQLEFEFIDLIEYQGVEYVVLLPCEEGADQVIILSVDSSDDETESYCSVEDEDVLVAVFNIFKDKFKDEFNFAD